MPMALLHQVYLTSAPLLCCPVSRLCYVANSARPSSVRPTSTPQVLLGMSESDLQQLATDFGQQKYRGKQLHHLLYKAKVKDIHAFNHLPQAFRNDLQEAGWTVERSSIYQALTAADDTVKVLAFAVALECRKITVSIRQTRGLDASAACGQLKNEFQKTPVLATAEMLIIFSSNATQTTNLTPL